MNIRSEKRVIEFSIQCKAIKGRDRTIKDHTIELEYNLIQDEEGRIDEIFKAIKDKWPELKESHKLRDIRQANVRALYVTLREYEDYTSKEMVLFDPRHKNYNLLEGN